MRIDRATAERAATHPNVVAFLRVIRERESNQNEDAWTIINGGSHFADFSKHPFEGMSTLRGGRAAGAYQFIPSTWAEVAQQLGLPDFTPPNQTLGAVARIAYRDALDDVIAGRLEAAVRKCRAEWTSLPGASENRGYTMAQAAEVFRAYGGTQVGEAQPAAPIEDRSIPHKPTKETTVAPIVIPILQAISAFLPALAKIFNDGSVKGQRIEAVAPMLSDAIVKVTGAVNLQEAHDKIVAAPEAAKEANKAVEDAVYHLTEVGGGIEAARRHDLAVANASAPTPLLRMPSFVITMALLPLIFFVVFMVLAGRGLATVLAVMMTDNPELIDRIAISFNVSADMQNVVITAIIAGVLSGITGFFLGTSFGSQRKDVTINNLTQ